MLKAVYKKDGKVIGIDTRENSDYLEFVDECNFKAAMLYSFSNAVGDYNVTFSFEVCEE